jgi:hypothetical protein
MTPAQKPPQNAASPSAPSPNLASGGQRGDGAAACRLAQHAAVFRRGAGDVVFTGFGAALGQLGRQKG